MQLHCPLSCFYIKNNQSAGLLFQVAILLTPYFEVTKYKRTSKEFHEYVKTVPLNIRLSLTTLQQRQVCNPNSFINTS